jgi:hypothetical protein
MVWFYQRDNVSLRLEVRYDNDTAHYVAIFHHHGGRQVVHRFDNQETFREWLVAQEQRLAAERWTLEGPPEILLDGWPDKRPMI